METINRVEDLRYTIADDNITLPGTHQPRQRVFCGYWSMFNHLCEKDVYTSNANVHYYSQCKD